MLSTWLVSVLATAAAVAATPIEKRASSFSLYAYGTGLSGLRVFTAGEQAFVGDYSLVDDDEAAPVLFTKQSDSTLLGNPDTSNVSTATWSNLTYFVSAPSSHNHTVGFIPPSANSSQLVTEFTFYGAWIATTGKGGTLETLWYATPTNITGVYSLKWNLTSDSTDGQVPVSLTKTAPSS